MKSNLYCDRDRRLGPITEKRSEAISLGQCLRFEKSNARKKASIAVKKSWAVGKLAKHRIVWTPEMDEELKRLCELYSFKWMRTEGAKRIGVGEHSLRDRLKYLGLKCKQKYPKNV